jgi:pyruvate,water dikinase
LRDRHCCVERIFSGVWHVFLRKIGNKPVKGRIFKILTYTKYLAEINKDSLSEAGGKGANLGELIHANIPVPPGFIVTTSAYRTHLEEAGLQECIANRLEGLAENDLSAITKASDDISLWIEAAPIPATMRGR